MFELSTAWLVTYLCHSSVLLGLAWWLTRRLGGDRLALQEMLWRAALLGAVATASLQLAVGWSSPLLAGSVEPAAAARTMTAAVVPAAELSSTVVAPAASTPMAAWWSAADEVPWRYALLAIWWAGMVVLSGRLLRSQRRLARRLAGRRRLLGGRLFEIFRSLVRPLGGRGRMALTSSEGLEVPIARGLLRREVCLPGRLERELSDDQQESVLAHEVAHLARRDPSWLLVYRLVEAALFLQPLNRLAVRRLEEIAEYRCDDWAVEKTGRPLALARCLTRVADWAVRPAGPIAVPTMAARGSGLERRVRRLLDRERRSPHDSPGWLPFAVAATLLATVLLAPGGAPLLASAPEPPLPPEGPTEPVAAPPPDPSSAPAIPREPDGPLAPEAPVRAAEEEPAPAAQAPPSPQAPKPPLAPTPPQVAVPPRVPEPPQASTPLRAPVPAAPAEAPSAVLAPVAREAPPAPPAVAVESAFPPDRERVAPAAPWRPRTEPRPMPAPVPVSPIPSPRPPLAPPAANPPLAPRFPSAVLAPPSPSSASSEASFTVVPSGEPGRALGAAPVAVLPSPPGVGGRVEPIVVADGPRLAGEFEADRARQLAEELEAVRARQVVQEREAVRARLAAEALEAQRARELAEELRGEASRVRERERAAAAEAQHEVRMSRRRELERRIEARQRVERAALAERLAVEEARLARVRDRQAERLSGAAAASAAELERLGESLSEVETRLEAVEERLEELDRAAGAIDDPERR